MRWWSTFDPAMSWSAGIRWNSWARCTKKLEMSYSTPTTIFTIIIHWRKCQQSSNKKTTPSGKLIISGFLLPHSPPICSGRSTIRISGISKAGIFPRPSTRRYFFRWSSSPARNWQNWKARISWELGLNHPFLTIWRNSWRWSAKNKRTPVEVTHDCLCLSYIKS